VRLLNDCTVAPANKIEIRGILSGGFPCRKASRAGLTIGEEELILERNNWGGDSKVTVEQKPEEKQLVDNHREEMIALIRRINTETGIPNTPPSRTAQELREMQVARGVRPEDNTASRELIRLRDRDYREDE